MPRCRGASRFFFERLEARPALSFSSHSVEPAAVLALAHDLFGASPQGYALGVRGYEFNEFGERLSQRAQANLAEALRFLERILRNPALLNGDIETNHTEA